MGQELKSLFELIAFGANTSTLWLNLGKLGVKFPLSSVKKSIDDQVELEKILNELFYRKQIMWEKPEYEDFKWSINSLKDLRDKCDGYCDILLLKRNTDYDKYHFLASLIRVWGSYADECYKELVKSNGSLSAIKKNLKKFRKKSYPIVATILFSIDNGKQIKDNGFKKLEKGMKNTGLKLKQILPKWSIEEILP